MNDEIKPAILFARTDLGNAEYFANKYKGAVKYDHLRGKWFTWDTVRWKEDDSGFIYRLAKTALRERGSGAYLIQDSDTMKAEIKHSLLSESRNRVEAMLSLAQKEKTIADTGRQWDLNPWLLGTDSGTVDLRTGELLPPKSSNRITKSTGFKFNPAAICPLWEKTIASYWDEKEIQEYVHRAMGYSVTGATYEQCLFTLYGLGENGKSTVLGTVARVLGDYSYTMPFSTIEMQSRSAISNDVAMLVGRRFVMSSETQEDIRLNEGRIKSLTGDTTMTARFLYKENFSFRPLAKFWLAFNHKPRIYDDSHGFWRRMRMIKMDKVFTDADKIPDLEGQLQEELPGILNWLIKGCRAWQAERLTTPPMLQAATDEYRDESDPLRDFILDRCNTGIQYSIGKTELYESYADWVKRHGIRFGMSLVKFNQRIEARGFTEDRPREDGGRKRIWRGIELAGPFQASVDD